MFRQTLAAVGVIAAATISHRLDAQYNRDTGEVQRSGPRYGVIWLSPAITDSVSVHFKNQKINPTTSLFGWEFQRELLKNPNGVVPVSSLVFGVAGLDQGLVLPSATWLIGMRNRDDIELGIGPNLSLAGAALAVTAGMTFHSGQLNIPIDIAYVSSKIGTRASVTTGFNIMR
ncbi:MAG TPA: hypothetical protein VIV65_02525 [Gemmatimonadaceae bacterium]